MKTLVELYDDNVPFFNIIATLIYNPQILVFLCTKSRPDEIERIRITNYLKIRSQTLKIIFIDIEIQNPIDIIRKLKEVYWGYEECVFEITGGNDFLLSLVSQFAHQNQIPLLYKDVRRSCAIWNSIDKIEIETYKLPKLKLKDILFIHDATIERTDHCFPNNNNDRKIAKDITELFLDNLQDWPMITSWFQKNTFNLENKLLINKQPLPGKNEDNCCLIEFLYKLRNANAVKDLSIDYDGIVFKYRSTQLYRLLANQGVCLELLTYLECLESNYFDDIYMSAVIRWGRVNFRELPSNEIDVVVLKGITAIFISCKTTITKRTIYDLYEIKTLCERFGGSYAKSILVTSDSLDNSPGIIERAKIMDVKIIDINVIKNGELIKELQNNIYMK